MASALETAAEAQSAASITAVQNGCSSPQLHCTSAAPQHKVDVKTDTELPSDASSELSLPEPEGQPWDDRCPAEIAPVGTILPWNAPSLFNTASLVSVLTAAPVTEEQLFPIAWGWEKTGYPEELPLASGVTEGLDVVRRQAENDDHPTTDTKPSGTDDLEDKDAASRAERADSCEPVDLEVHWPKRHALPLLDFLDEKGRPPAATIGSTGKIVECRPKPGSSLQLDELLAAGVDVPSQVWRCTVLPSEYTVVLKLLTDQARLDPPEKRITREVYSRVRDYSKASLGRNAQMDINLEADVFEALGPLQGTRVPYSYGYYAFTLPKEFHVVGHVMEFVPSLNLHRYFHTIVKNDPVLVDKFYTSLLRTYIEIHSMGIAHRDPGIRNMLLYPSWDGDFKVVVIDFTISSFITLAEKANLTWSDTESLLMHQCLIDELDEKSFRQWKASKRGKLVWEAFQRGPGKYFEPDFEDSSYGKSPRLQLHTEKSPEIDEDEENEEEGEEDDDDDDDELDDKRAGSLPHMLKESVFDETNRNPDTNSTASRTITVHTANEGGQGQESSTANAALGVEDSASPAKHEVASRKRKRSADEDDADPVSRPCSRRSIMPA